MINEILFFCKNVTKLCFLFLFFSKYIVGFFSSNFHSESGKNVLGGLSESHTGLRYCWDTGVATVFSPSQNFIRGLNLLNSSENMYRTFYIKRNPSPYEFVLHFLKECSRAQAMVGLTHQKSLWTV